jgi:hypothetical protein
MDGIPTQAGRARRAKGASGGKSRKSGVGSRYGSARRVLVTGTAAVVFVAAFMLDTEAVARLLRACLAGQAGVPARIAASAVVLLLLGVIGVVVYRPAPAAKPRKRATRPAARADAPTEAADDAPRAAARAGRRGGKRAAPAATDRGA